MTVRRWPMRCGMRLLFGALVALSMLSGLLAAPGAPTVRASGPGPCAPITPTEMVKASLGPVGGVSARLSRTQGTAGTALTITGAHWPAGAAVSVDLYMKRNGTIFLDSPVVQGTVSADGSLILGPFRAPMSVACSSLNLDNQDGGHVLLLVHTQDRRMRAPLTFTYLTYTLGPTIKISNLGGFGVAPGTRFIVTGMHWEPGERVTLTPEMAPWNAQPQVPPKYAPILNEAVSATADSQGALVATLPPLNEPPETQLIVMAQGTGPRYGEVSEYAWGSNMLPKVFPSLRLDHSGVTAGAPLTVTGDHWPANVAGIIEYCSQQSTLPGMVGLRCLGGQQLGDFQTDATGRFNVTVHLPSDASLGPITVQARVPGNPFGLIVYAQGQPLMIVPTFAEAHPRLSRLLAHWPYLAASALALLTLLGALAALLIRRWRNRGGAAHAVSGL